MFYELIYTRCRQGIDITRKGQAISSDGYKVYSCTPAVMEEGEVDLQFLANAAQAKQSYADPGFMDDAYIFYVPDTGKSFFVNFHPVHFDPNAPGDYSHRPGNFVNHALIGDFSGQYPYKMFQDDGIWAAKTKGEAYYYENEPAAPAERDIVNTPGHYGFGELGAFIADGRKEALQKAVAFLVAQYKEEPEKRKYLVIKDDSSEKIELWIAAIESAFSPRVASVIPFATRMDKFANINRYTVKLGIYQPQMNLQDPNHKQRYRAMIVGVDERDKANVNTSRPLANSPFVLLDGKQKQAMFEADTSNQYYQLITRFDEEHKKFCEEFLQAFSVSRPSTEIYDFYELFSVLNEPSRSNAQTLAIALDKLNKYQVTGKAIYLKIYESVDREVSRFMQEDLSTALSIVNWLQAASQIIGDAGAKTRLTEAVCTAFKGIIFGRGTNAVKQSLWTKIKGTDFAKDAAGIISSREIFESNMSSINTFSPADIVAFAEISLDASSLTGGIEQHNLKTILKLGIKTCYRNNDVNSLQQISSLLSQIKGVTSQGFLLDSIKEEDKGFGEFVIKFIINSDSAITASDEALRSFCQKLNAGNLVNLISLVLIRRINLLKTHLEMDSFIKTLKSITPLDRDCGFVVFKSIEDKTRRDTIAEYIVKTGLDKEEQLFILDILLRANIDYFSTYINKLLPAAKKNRDKWNSLISYISDNKNEQKYNVTFECIVQALVSTKQSEKSLEELGSLLDDDEKNHKYFDSAADKAWEIISSQKPKSVLGKIFGSKDDKTKTDKKE